MRPKLFVTEADMSKLGNKRQACMSRDLTKKYFEPAREVLKIISASCTSGKIDMNKIKSLSKKLDVAAYQKNPKLWNFSLKPTRLREKGWGTVSDINYLHGLMNKNLSSVGGNVNVITKVNKNMYFEGMAPEDSQLLKQVVKQSVNVVRQTFYTYSQLLFRNTAIIKNNI